MGEREDAHVIPRHCRELQRLHLAGACGSVHGDSHHRGPAALVRGHGGATGSGDRHGQALQNYSAKFDMQTRWVSRSVLRSLARYG